MLRRALPTTTRAPRLPAPTTMSRTVIAQRVRLLSRKCGSKGSLLNCSWNHATLVSPQCHEMSRASMPLIRAMKCFRRMVAAAR